MRHSVSVKYILYPSEMPKLWSKTVETHRHEVREAIQDAAARLVSEQGLRSVTMSQIAEETGIGRATLYKYYPDVESILRDWHERQIAGHLEQLRRGGEGTESPVDRLSAVLEDYALIAYGSRGHRDTELAVLLHSHHQSHKHAEQELKALFRNLIRDAATAHAVRTDVSPDELAQYCLSALSASHTLSSKSAVGRLVQVTLAGLRP